MNDEAAYFNALSDALADAHYHHPTLVIDLERLNGNLALAKAVLPAGLGMRIVDKSLPSLPLIRHIMEALGTRKIMSFHLPLTLQVLDAFPDADILFGKPMPVAAVEHGLKSLASEKRQRLISQTVWLIDTPERLKQYGQVAQEAGVRLKIAFEVDCGMHRGGFANAEALAAVLPLLAEYSALTCKGIMGYEAHIPQIPTLFGGPEKEQASAQQRLASFAAVLPPQMREIINTGGSKTSLTYSAKGPANEVSMGSGFLMPTDFEVDALQALKPAVFIATPVLKVLDTQLPGPPFVTRLMQALGLFPRRGCFIYGGKWYADPVWPPDMRENKLWGSSSNQQLMALASDSRLKADDFVFFRPTQSEAVLQYFGPLALYADQRIESEWSTITAG
ncbi:alanine racemase [Rhizobium sp. L1K21]|uniref:alanine racemase n=1 Tax=Rhizobium sp. L1K21 TaxID=2954933 RepID=UPI0020934A84|nr:alanine racemase [Rhizobium sp. L1K21]MCO6187058.1 alanine racemase [Rhizobium sp. L1K21]